MMTWTPVETSRGTWAVSWPHVEKIITWYHKSALALRYSSRVEIKQKMGSIERFFRSPVYSLDVDWDRVSMQAAHNTRAELGAWQSGGMGRRDGPDDSFLEELIDDLSEKIIQSRRNRDQLRLAIQSTSAASMQTVSRDVAHLQGWVTGATLVRDLSADFVIVGVGVLTGGAGAGAGAALKTAAIKGGSAGVIKFGTKLQDTGSVGAASVTMGGEVVASLVPLGSLGKAGEFLVVTGVKGVAAGTATMLLPGSDMSDALADSATSVGEEVAKAMLEKTVFRQWMAGKAFLLPASITVDTTKALGEFGAGALGQGAVALAKHALSGPPKGQGSLVERGTLFAELHKEYALLSIALVPPEGRPLAFYLDALGSR
jgi:hypothetical protein